MTPGSGIDLKKQEEQIPKGPHSPLSPPAPPPPYCLLRGGDGEEQFVPLG